MFYSKQSRSEKLKPQVDRPRSPAARDRPSGPRARRAGNGAGYCGYGPVVAVSRGHKEGIMTNDKRSQTMSQKPLIYRDLELEVSNYQPDGTFQVRVLASPAGSMTAAKA